MAHRQAVLLMAVLAVASLASLASAMDWMVGDNDGWRAKFNETGWATGKTFRVGDTLMFMYTKGVHTVAQVSNKEAFAACNLEANQQLGFWDSGSDVVHLNAPGKMWFICTKPNHCANGMKLVINVEESTAPAPSPLPAPPPAQSSAPVSYTAVRGAVAVAAAAAALAF